jgi:hypothetical protein
MLEAEDADFIGEMVAKQYMVMEKRELLALVQIPEDLDGEERIGYALIAFGENWLEKFADNTGNRKPKYDA